MREGLLEAFKDLRDYTACNNCVYQKEKECVKGNFCIWNDIEKELKGKEELEKAFDSLSKDDEKAKKELSKEIEKNRALEIIKEKPQATLWLFQHCDKKMEYEDMISLFKEDITEEQFELLKEVLL